MDSKFLFICVLMIFVDKSLGVEQTFKCDYDYGFWGDSCTLTSSSFGSLNDTIVITGNHAEGKSNSDVKSVSCSGPTNCKFTVFPTPIYSEFLNMQALTLSNVGLMEISENSLGNCENLSNLQVDDNKIEVLEAGSFKNCRNLKTLSILSNSISDVHKDAFMNLENLKDLNLYDNYIETIDPETFQHVFISKCKFN